MDRRILCLFIIFIIIKQIVNFPTENELLLSRYRRSEKSWKTSDVLKCIRRLRSIIIHPSKHDISTEMLNCLQQPKTPKSDKKNKKT